MRKTRIEKLLFFFACMLLCVGITNISAYATQDRTANFTKSYTLGSNAADNIYAVANAQLGRNGASLGYTEGWCADFVSDCAALAGQGEAIPRSGGVQIVYNNVINAGGSAVTGIPQKGDLAIYNWGSSDYWAHIEYVYDVVGTTVYTIGGNTDSNYSTNATRIVKKHSFAYTSSNFSCFVRPKYRNVVVDTQAPTISNVQITNVTKSGYRVSCTATDNVGVTSVMFPTWTDNNSYAIWHEGKKDGNTYYYDVKTSEHENAVNCWYYTHIYAYDAANNHGFYGAPETFVDNQAPVISNVQITNVTSIGYRVSCTVTDNGGVTSVKFPTWTGNNSAIWHDGVKSGNTYYYDVKTSEHDNAVNCWYYTHIYAYDAAGNQAMVGAPETFVETFFSGKCGDNVTWKLTNDGTVTISGTGAMSNYYSDFGGAYLDYKSNIKKVIIDFGVTTIGNNAFYCCTRLTSITIPNSVTTIGQTAFSGCTGLTSITIPNSVTTIKQGAFFRCSGLTSITIPNSVTTIASDVFRECSGMTSVTIPNSVTSIGISAFYKCSGLTSITIPNSVTSIGIYAFNECSGLTSITIPNSVTSIGIYAFNDCTKLKLIKAPIHLKEDIEAAGVPSGTTVEYYCPHTNKIKNPISKFLKSSATCTSPAVYYYECADCHEKLTDIYSYGKALGHKENTVKTPATVSKDGSIVKSCSRCKKELSRTKINRAYVKYDQKVLYTGKAIKPVKIVDAKGKAISSSNYTITYKNNTKVGKATATVTFKNNYSGTNNYSFEIVPKNTSIVSLKAATKALTVTWKKVSTDFTGYQIQYATSGDFKSGAKTVTVKSKTATSRTISSLKSGKNYYVRIRVYKTVSGKNYYSDWSKATKVKVK